MAAGLLGRRAELGRLREILDRTGFVAVTGPGGIGKTVLIDALIDGRRRSGHRVVEVRGTHGLREVPFGAFLRFLDVGRGETDTATAAGVLETIRGDAVGPVLLSIDDAHLLDPASAGLVASLIGTDELSVVVTARVPADAPRDVQGLFSRRPDELLDLGPLTTEEITVFVEESRGWEPSDDEVATIESATLGYPLYLRALVASSDGPLTDPARRSPQLIELLEQELAGVDGDERLAFDVIAVADSMDRTTASSIVGEEAVERLLGLGLLRVRQGLVEVVHPLLGSVAVDSMATGRRREVAERRLAATRDAPAPDLAAATAEAISVGVRIPPDLLVPAVRAAVESRSFDLVEQLTRGVDDHPALQVARSVALRHLGEVPEPLELADESARVEAVTARAQALAFVEGRSDEALALLSETLQATIDPALRARLAMELVVLSGLASDLDAMRVGAQSVVETGVADPDTALLAEAVTLFAEGLTLTTVRSADTYRRGLTLLDAAPISDPLLRERLEMSRVLVALADGDLHDARRRCDTVDDTIVPGAWLTIESLLGDAWLPPSMAAERASAAVRELGRFDPLGNLPQATHLLRLRSIQTGVDPPVPAPDTAMNLGWRAAAIEEVMSGRIDGWAAWRAGDGSAVTTLADAGRAAIGAGHRLWGLCALVDAVRLGAGRAVAADLEELAVLRGSGLARIGALAARAESPADWWSVAKAWWQAGAPTYAVEAAIRAGEDDPICAAGAQLLAARGAVPVVGEIDGPLTDRQVAVITEVLAGGSNRDVAQRLFLAKRTVDNHLARAYTTAGIDGGRDELEARFGWIAPCGGEPSVR